MQSVFLLHHEYDDDAKLIGVYRTHALAKAAILRLVVQPGFGDVPDGFIISEYPLDKDHWTEGFASCTDAMVDKES